MDQLAVSLVESHHEHRILEAIRSYGGRLRAFVRARVRSDDEAADIMQDVWLQLSRMVDVDAIGQISAWLFAVARNRIVDIRRKKRAIPVSRLSEEGEDADESIEDILFVEPETPEDVTLRRRFWQELFRALDELPEPQRQVFIWNEIEDLTFREIAERTGENIKTLISRKRYAVKYLRRRLADLRDEMIGD